MCLEVRKQCECGTHTVQFHMRDNIMIPEVINRIFCPSCPGNSAFDRTAMINDNGWVIEYDMDMAQALAKQKMQMVEEKVDPEFLFDQGLACWQEMYPGERNDMKEAKDKIVELLKEDQQKYLQAIQSWNIDRVEQLKAQGWRKAQHA